jgi:two-component system, chemotaxis family, protein-glutamate methylesterase/glutaminase
MRYEAVTMGVSSGGMSALKVILPALPADFPLPLIIVQHIGAQSEGFWIDLLNNMCKLEVKEADEKESIQKGKVYIAPPNYHLLVEPDRTFALSTDKRVNFARPSIDVLFESAAIVYREKLIGVVLTGSNNDGARGLAKIKELGGLAIVQDPETAESSSMPLAALQATQTIHSYPLEKITTLLIEISKT